MKLKQKAYDILHTLQISNPKLHYLGAGIEGEAYSFEKKKKQYILKVFHEGKKTGHEKLFDPLSSNHIKYIKELSKYGLIPKIYKITPYFYIQKYIKGITLDEFLGGTDKRSRKSLKIPKFVREKIYHEIENLISKWHKLGFYNADLHTQNILISNINKNPKVYFIDPYVPCSRMGLTKSTIALRQDEDNRDLRNIKYDLIIRNQSKIKSRRSSRLR